MAAQMRAGFTLLEIIIVTSLIALFSAIAIISIQGFFDQTRKKLMYPEAEQLGKSLQLAHDNLAIYPRLHLLSQDLSTVVIRNPSNELVMRPHFDTYGTLGATRRAGQVNNQWKGPYSSKTRTRLSQGHRSFVIMRLLDQQTLSFRSLFQQQTGQDISLVDWPADTWGNPWVVYQVVRTFENGLARYRLAQPGEDPSFLNAVVSYGANRVPGGTIETQLKHPAYYATLTNASLVGRYEVGDDPDGAEYVLRSYGITGALSLSNLTSEDLEQSFYFPGTVNDAEGAVGMLQDGTDDVVWEF